MRRDSCAPVTRTPTCEHVFALTLDEIEPKAVQASAYLEGVSEAEQLARKGNNRAALAIYTRIAGEMPGVALAHTRRGELLAQSMKFREALSALEQASASQRTAQTELDRAGVLANMLRFDEARAVMRDALEDWPTHRDLLNTLANTLPADQVHERIRLYYRAVIANPTYGPPAYNLKKRYDNAVKDGDERVLSGDLMPTDGRWLSVLAVKCGQGKRHEDAVRLWEMAFRAAPEKEAMLVDGYVYRVSAAWQAIRCWIDYKDWPKPKRMAHLEKALAWIEGWVAECEREALRVDPSGAANLLKGLARHGSLPGRLHTSNLKSPLVREEDHRRLKDLHERVVALYEPLALKLCEAEDLSDASLGVYSGMLAAVGGRLGSAGHLSKALRLFDTAQEMDTTWHGRWHYCYNGACTALRGSRRRTRVPSRRGNSVRRRAAGSRSRWTDSRSSARRMRSSISSTSTRTPTWRLRAARRSTPCPQASSTGGAGCGSVWTRCSRSSGQSM